MILTTVLTIALISSMIINFIFVWYTRKLLNYLEMTNEEAREVFSSLVNFENHLSEVYGKDTFYGDPTLESLLKHTNEMADEMQNFLQVNEDLTNLDSETNDA
jgi:hypothetical protein